MKRIDMKFGMKKVLMIVEDYDFIRNVVGGYFQTDGYEIISAGNMQEAMVIGEAELPKVVIVDFDMKTNDPYLIVSILHNILPLSQIVLVNGRHKQCNQEEAKIAGVNRILERIFDPAVLDEVINIREVEAVH
jgi:response regulator RpfG family c-di-GMP phosphodiesterase